jgi:hypothetical protein
VKQKLTKKLIRIKQPLCQLVSIREGEPSLTSPEAKRANSTLSSAETLKSLQSILACAHVCISGPHASVLVHRSPVRYFEPVTGCVTRTSYTELQLQQCSGFDQRRLTLIFREPHFMSSRLCLGKALFSQRIRPRRDWLL